MSYEKTVENCTLASHVERFIRERKFLHGVTPATLAWYKYSFQAFQPVLEANFTSGGEIKMAVISRIEKLQSEGRGNKAVSINTYLRCFKAFLKWCYEEKIINEPVPLPWLKEEQEVLATFGAPEIERLLKFRAATHAEKRTHLLICTLIDTGIRINEALDMSKEKCDFENLVIKVNGKGGKERLVPMSLELRKLLYKFAEASGRYVFGTKNNTKLSQRDFLRDFKKIGKKLGITGVRVSAHTCRHTFATFYLRRGGNLFYLSKILGHSHISTTQRYLESLGIDDLQAVHSSLSVLSGR